MSEIRSNKEQRNSEEYSNEENSNEEFNEGHDDELSGQEEYNEGNNDELDEEESDEETNSEDNEKKESGPKTPNSKTGKNHSSKNIHHPVFQKSHYSPLVQQMTKLKISKPEKEELKELVASSEKKRTITQHQDSFAPGLSLESIFTISGSAKKLSDKIADEIRELNNKPRGNGKNETLDILRKLKELLAQRESNKSKLNTKLKNEKNRLKINNDISKIENEIINKIKKLHNHKSFLTICEDLIIEHASRRVDLFFYILVAYHNTKIYIIQNYPRWQHGQGRNHNRIKFTDGAHSSIFSQFADLSHIRTEKEKIEFKGKTTNKQSGKKTDKEINQARESILCGTHFLDVINGVIEIPYIVNLAIDKRLEGGILTSKQSEHRKKSLEIIQDVSNGEYDPIEGLKKFLKEMKSAFTEIEENINTEYSKQKEKAKKSKKNLAYASRKKELSLKSLELQKFGTFGIDINKFKKGKEGVHLNNQDQISNEYIDSLLAREREDRETVIAQPLANKAIEKISKSCRF